MKKFINLSLSFILVVFASIFLVACGSTYKVAYCQFLIERNSEQVAIYDAHSEWTKIYLYESIDIYNADTFKADYIMQIVFDEGGLVPAESNNGIECSYCAISDEYIMIVSIGDKYYDENKSIYLNGEDIMNRKEEGLGQNSEKVHNFWFKNFGLIDSSSSNFVNTIEYR